MTHLCKYLTVLARVRFANLISVLNKIVVLRKIKKSVLSETSLRRSDPKFEPQNKHIFYLKMGQKLDTLHFRERTSDIDTKYVTAVTRWMPMYVMITADDVR